MSSIQLEFSLRTHPSVKTVHLLGNWDNYQNQLPLATHKSGYWCSNFRFQGATLTPGQRYWYYYIIDGYHASHDPSKPSTTEPTTGRTLNVLDVPANCATTTTTTSRHSAKMQGHIRQTSEDVPRGRGVSPSKIQSPLPQRVSAAARHLAQADYSAATVAQLSEQLGAAHLGDSDSDTASDVPSFSSGSSRSSSSSSPSSTSSNSSFCTCDRYGITRSGERVKLDCGGSQCGCSDESSCSSESEGEYNKRTTRRQGMVIYE